MRATCQCRVVKMSQINCEVCLLDSSADPVMWKCVGCTRKFHAACVGVVVPRGSLRNLKKDKKAVDPSSFILPCCNSCQILVTANFEFNLLTQQQKQLADQIDKNTQVVHQLNLQQEKPNNVAESMQGLEILLSSIKNELSFINKNSSLAGSVIAIKNHITSLIDTSIMSTKQNVNSATAELKTHLLSQLNQNTLETTASCIMQNNSMREIDILDELKMLSASINAIKDNHPVPPTPDPLPSLEVELNDDSDSGWRLLGTSKVWKADWAEYDARKLRRLQQQKLAEKARKRRKHNNNNNNKNRNNNNSNRNNFPYHHTNNNYGINFSDINHSNNNYNNNHSSQNRNNLLPPDRELLVAAKERFSRPPGTDRPIQFQRREILNPYPASDVLQRSHPAQLSNFMAPGSSSAASCVACSGRHSCFQRN